LLAIRYDYHRLPSELPAGTVVRHLFLRFS
jgi:ADP-ribose pyrophosphatase